jgi:hypothetical protein
MFDQGTSKPASRHSRPAHTSRGCVTIFARIQCDSAIALRKFARNGLLWRDLKRQLTEHVCRPVKILAMNPLPASRPSRTRTVLVAIEYRIYPAWEIAGNDKRAMEAFLLQALTRHLGFRTEFMTFDLLIDEYVDV